MSINPGVIPNYSNDIQATANLGRQDRILVDLDCWTLSGTLGQLVSFTENVTGIFFAADGELRQVFTSPQGRFPDAVAFPIWGARQNSGEAVQIGRPLISGKVLARRQGPRVTITDATILTYRLKATLALNPTKWLNNQPTSLTRSPAFEWPDIPPTMFAALQSTSLNESLLVEGPNVIIGTDRHLHMAHPAYWSVQLTRYFGGVVRLLEEQFFRACGASDATCQRTSESTKIKEVETYWEFWSRDPLAEMRRIEQQLRTIAASSQVTWQPVDDEAQEALPASNNITLGAEDNSPRVLIRLATGIELRVYAKTTRRLRFEVVHTCHEARSVFPTRATSTFAGLASLLDPAREDGTRRLNTILSACRSLAGPSSASKMAHELVTDIYGALQSKVDARTIVSALIATGRVAVYQGCSFTPSVQRLRTAGILEHSGQLGTDHVSVVTEPYRRALAALRTSLPPSV